MRKASAAIAIAWWMLFAGHVSAGERGLDTHTNTKFALLDVINHALARETVHSDLHTYQRQRLGLQDGQRAAHQYYVSHGEPVCDTPNGVEAWLNLQCKAFDTVTEDKCGSDLRCISIRLAPFVVSNNDLYEAVMRALAEPCNTVPDPQSLAHFKVLNIHEPGTYQAATMDWDWLFCSHRPVTAKITHEGNGVFTIRYRRELHG